MFFCPSRKIGRFLLKVANGDFKSFFSLCKLVDVILHGRGVCGGGGVGEELPVSQNSPSISFPISFHLSPPIC